MNQVIAPVSGKGGVAKTSLTIGLAQAAAIARDRTVIVVDLDQGHGATDVLEASHPSGATVITAGQGRPVAECLAASDLFDRVAPGRVRVLSGTEDVERFPLTGRPLHAVIAQCRELADLVLIDTQNFAAAMVPVLSAADRIILPAFLDGLSLPAPEVILGRAVATGTLDRVGGIVFTQVRRSLSRGLQATIDYYVSNGYAYPTCIREAQAWKHLLLGRLLSGPAEAEVVALYDCIQTRVPETEALRALARPARPDLLVADLVHG